MSLINLYVTVALKAAQARPLLGKPSLLAGDCIALVARSDFFLFIYYCTVPPVHLLLGVSVQSYLRESSRESRLLTTSRALSIPRSTQAWGHKIGLLARATRLHACRAVFPGMGQLSATH